MGKFQAVVLLVLATWLGCGPAFADKRMALVIGNSAYQKAPKLSNPANDATLVADMFKNAGFEVTTRLDVNVSDMRKALREFGSRTHDAEIAVIYYAGHGLEFDGNNYLIPIDATLETDADVLDETVALDRVLFAIEPAKRLRLVILDACRDNPFAQQMKRTMATRSIGRGLAKVEPNVSNTLIAFSAKAGSTASDGDGENSPFAASLVKYLPRPGLDLRRAFGFVRDDVLANTGNKQEPYVYGSLGGDDMPLVAARPVASLPPDPQNEVRRDYELALQLDTRDGWTSFLNNHPAGFYTDLAKGQLDKITANEVLAAASQKARLAEQEKARLAREGAKPAEQASAAAEAVAAETARIAAEKAKQAQMNKAVDAERSRASVENADSPAAVPDSPPAAAARAESNAGTIAALSPPEAAPANLVKSMQLELRRVGCLTAAADGEWNGVSQRSLGLFNRFARTQFDTKVASIDALDAVKARSARVCPLVCDHGFRAVDDACVKIVCRTGYELDDDDTCKKVETRRSVSRHNRPEQAERVKPAAPKSQEASNGPQQYYCNRNGCGPVKRGCHLATFRAGDNQSYGNNSFQICH